MPQNNILSLRGPQDTRGSHFSNKRLRKTVYIMKSQEVEKFLKLIEEVKKKIWTPFHFIILKHQLPYSTTFLFHMQFQWKITHDLLMRNWARLGILEFIFFLNTSRKKKKKVIFKSVTICSIFRFWLRSKKEKEINQNLYGSGWEWTLNAVMSTN